jgi:hypothetical protein
MATRCARRRLLLARELHATRLKVDLSEVMLAKNMAATVGLEQRVT